MKNFINERYVKVKTTWGNVAGIFGLLLVNHATYAAIPQQCVQLPYRTQACPHLLYKKSVRDIDALNIKTGQMVCLCLSDLHKLLQADLSEAEKISQQVDWLQFNQQYKLQKTDILALIQQ